MDPYTKHTYKEILPYPPGLGGSGATFTRRFLHVFR